MDNSQETTSTAYVSYANDLSIWFASRWPDNSPEVASFLHNVAFAMDCREADLARYLGVTRATLSGWKARGSIPRSHAQWFTEEFPFLAIGNTTPGEAGHLRHAGLEAVMHLLRQTDFNPFGLEAIGSDRIFIVCRFLPGLTRLGQFIQHRVNLGELGAKDDLAEVAATDLGMMARAVATRLMPDCRVSH